MKGVMVKLEKWFDIYIAYFLFNGNKQQNYYEYLRGKYGKNYENL
jgi:hypothetical protein